MAKLTDAEAAAIEARLSKSKSRQWQFTKVVLDAVAEVLKERLDALSRRIAELEAGGPNLANCFRGTWQPGSFERGSIVVWEGSLWLALRDTSAKPGTGDDFRLIVKRGRDGKDVRP